MIFKQDKNLALVAARAQKDPADVAYILTQQLLNAGLINDNDECYGLPLEECLDGETSVTQLVEIIKQTGIDRVNDTTYSAFLACVLMGDGDCPECGGDMELIDFAGHSVSSHDRDVPSDYVSDYEKWRCPICGHTCIK